MPKGWVERELAFRGRLTKELVLARQQSVGHLDGVACHLRICDMNFFIIKTWRLALIGLIMPLSVAGLLAQTVPHAPDSFPPREACVRYSPGVPVSEPASRSSERGELRVALRILSSIDADGLKRYCYVDENGDEAPTLRVKPGGVLRLTLKNDISLGSNSPLPAVPSPGKASGVRSHTAHDPCEGGLMSELATNLHFHGLSIPPLCHQDDTLKTLIEPGDPPFEYRIEIPTSQPPGLYWYHPHVHGFSETQLLGGASGALIVEGVEHVNSLVSGLKQRVFVIRDTQTVEPSGSLAADRNRPTKELSINYVPVPYPKYPPAVIKMRPGERQFWRVVNASADTYLDLHLQIDGKPQNFSLISLDGVPLRHDRRGSEGYAPEQSRIFLPPAGRAEFIVTGPPAGMSGLLMTGGVYRGAGDENGLPVRINNPQPGTRAGQDDVDPTRPLALLVASKDDSASPPALTSASASPPTPQRTPLSAVRPVRKRTLFFSEKLVDPGNPKRQTLFFITVEGHVPRVFDPQSGPDIIVQQGEVEDWVIENRSLESHVFHIHQLHFLVVGTFGVPWEEPSPRDTINLPAWSGFGRFPSATLRMDFRDPAIVGTFPFHCHIMQHSDGGMMGKVRVEPVSRKPSEN